jgi:hypothetical protein
MKRLSPGAGEGFEKICSPARVAAPRRALRAILDGMRPTSRRAALLAAAIVLAAAGCGSRAPGAGPRPEPPPRVSAVVQAYSAARWIPARPTYALAARTVGDAQRAAGELLASFGTLADVDAAAVSRLLLGVLAVDPLSARALAEVGVDLEGSMALFSEAVNPTLVVHLAAPAQTQAFLDRLRADGMRTQSVMDGGVEIFTVALPGRLRVSWATDDGWLWVHFTLPFARDEGTAWFAASRRPGAPAWAGDWEWALGSGGQGARPAIVGFVDARAVIESVSPRIPAAIACAQLLAPVGRLAVAVEIGGDRLGGRLALELGDAAPGLARAALPAPAGWGAAAARAPLAAQWNLDLAAVRAHAAPCAQALDVDLSPLDRYGVRTARAILQRYDQDKPTNSRGAVSFDLAHRTYAAQLLDEIPGRSLIQRKRTFGPYQGYSLAIPFGGPTLEYVLDDQRALAGLGEGMLAAALGQGAGAPGPLFAIDVSPPAMPREAWAGLLGWVNQRPDALLAWRELHLAVAVEGTRLVIDASGRRR